MQIKLLQDIIDKIRRKRYDVKYAEMLETASFINKFVRIDNKVIQKLNKKHLFPQISLKADVSMFNSVLKEINASDIKLINNPLREHQLRVLGVAKELISVIEKEGIRPMLTGGALLGAIRHKGFIPWDDDIDFDLMRCDYNKLKKYLKETYICVETGDINNYNDFLERLDIIIKNNPQKIIVAQLTTSTSVYKGTSLEDCIVVDFFPRDYINPYLSEKEYQEYKFSRRKNLKKCKNWKDIFDLEKVELQNKNIYPETSIMTAKAWGSYGFMCFGKGVFVSSESILPSKKIHFEDTEFYTMNNPIEYLTSMYGDYMSIPTSINLANHIKSFSDFLTRNNRKYYITIQNILGE